MARQVGRKSCEAKAVVGHNKLEGATVEPGTASSLHPCGGQGKSNAARVRRAAQDRRRWQAGPDGITADGEGGGVAEPGGPSEIEPARSRVQAEVFCQWPARLDSAGTCACKATGHAREG
jgi:hypothetical protein